MFKLLHSKMSQELYESTFITKVATMKNTNGAVCRAHQLLSEQWSNGMG